MEAGAASEADVTSLLESWRSGDAASLDALLPLVLADLRRMARAELSRHRGHDTLQPTALVNEVFVRLLGHDALAKVEDRGHLMHLAARIMRQLLVARARASATDKRGGGWRRDELTESLGLPLPQDPKLAELDEALDRLQRLHPRMAQVVELRWFGGFEATEIAQVLGVTVRTVGRDWATARAWLRKELAW